MKRIRYITMLLIGIMLFAPMAAHASNISIDSMSAGNGIVRVSYGGIAQKTKVMVEKGATKYYYDLKKPQDAFPLQLGDGEYTVAVLENISGTSYKVLARKNFKAEIKEEDALYLNSAQPVTWDEDMEAIRLAKLLTEGMEDSKTVVQVLYDYTINNISYDYDKADKLSADYTPDIDSILKDGRGICYDYSVLFAAMLRSRGVPVKLVKGYRVGMKEYHAWNEVYLEGSWRVVDTTYSAWALKAKTSISLFQDKNQYQKLREY